MGNITKIFFAEQTKISELNLSQLENLLLNGESNIYVDSDNILRISEKNDDVVSEKNAVGDTIKSIDVENIPSNFPSADTGYAIMAVRDGSDYKLIWGLMDTIGNYNVITSSTTFTVTLTNPTHQLYDANTPGNYKFNGLISIITSGDGEFALKRYSIDNGGNFTDLSPASSYEFKELGSIDGVSDNLVVEDATFSTLYNEVFNLSAPDYLIDFIGTGLHTPNAISHIIYKSDDFSKTILSNIEVVINEDDTLLPGLFKYIIYESGSIIYETGYVADKSIRLQIPSIGIYSAQVLRLNAGYIELGKLSSTSSKLNYIPADLRWSKDNGENFLVASFTDLPYLLQGNGERVRINYTATEIGETGGDKLIYGWRYPSLEVYQTTRNITQSLVTSTQANTQVEVLEIFGSVRDNEFSSIFTSNTYSNPTVITQANTAWVPSQTVPGNPKIDFSFRVDYLIYNSGSNTELMMHLEDIDGNLITTEYGVLSNADPATGMSYDFYITDFESTISAYFNQNVRIRFTFDPDTTISDPNAKISSKLKFVQYV